MESPRWLFRMRKSCFLIPDIGKTKTNSRMDSIPSFNLSMDPNNDLPGLSTCTTCRYKEDKSNYWTAVLYFKASNGTYTRVIPSINAKFYLRNFRCNKCQTTVQVLDYKLAEWPFIISNLLEMLGLQRSRRYEQLLSSFSEYMTGVLFVGIPHVGWRGQPQA